MNILGIGHRHHSKEQIFGTDLSITVDGAGELAAALAELGHRGAENALRRAARKTVKPMVKTARFFAPYLTGALKKSLMTKVLGFNQEKQVKAYVGIRKGEMDVKVPIQTIRELGINTKGLPKKVTAWELGGKIIEKNDKYWLVRKKPEAYGWVQETRYHHYLEKTLDLHKYTFQRFFTSDLKTAIVIQRAKLASKKSRKK